MASKFPSPVSTQAQNSSSTETIAVDALPVTFDVADKVFLTPQLSSDASINFDAEEQALQARRAAVELEVQQLMEKKAAWQANVSKEEEEKKNMRALHDDIRALEIFRSKVPKSQGLSAEIILATQIDSSLRNLQEREAEGLLLLAIRRRKKRQNYINLASVLTFFAFYSFMLLVQRDQNAAFNIESR